ncbi:hypothetical protein ACE1MS_09070 [Lysinibacillus sp. fkY74-1]|uniref:Uncharacterized protein n=3 Tax=Lysinibacillus TaxID=400634 RepID=W7RRF5_LYSSH|nr:MULTISPECIES: hypothetical protein [Lysinibacillus]MBE5082456.1 hypothetical protein [Bacillus thuringiensis]EWH34207.1 hypothetical protein P799_07775 [Lysinibacillus sphaericus CBAM5]MBI6863869.1 hypothetical protein [Lysinibacillus fusiformis]MCS1394568.1 hypothetical protein [Lysinibacillus sp. PB211]MDM5350199.1 hypothetical protein [Lysinibacillus sphaericus]
MSNLQFLMLMFILLMGIVSLIKVYQIKQESIIKLKELEVELEKIKLEREK